MPRLFLERLLQDRYDPALMAEFARLIEDAVNKLSEGRINQRYNAATAAPTGTTVAYAVGDEIANSAPSELGSASSKYMIVGWKCVTAGTPGTWKEMRVLTGN